MKFSSLRIVWLGIITLLIFPLIGFLLFWIVEGEYRTILRMFDSDINLFLQIVLGVLLGAVFGAIAWQMVKSNYMRPVLEKYGQVVKSLKLNFVMILFLSFCAGVGEEFFFRGVLQDYLGVIITAVIFVLIHGYLNPFDKIIFTYGLLMTAIIVAVGFLDVYFGIISAMSAHMMIDIVLFYKLSNTNLLSGPTFIKSDVVFFENNQ